ncbi:hypothetical protein [Micromonospora aurantiaca (nom. illeg.)]|uniref:hypothetical protein n=1 Tax=Micromonospora aurantiaca (nom. illeg.) TaxID=47850 RepID=UPI0033E4491B
MWTFRSPQLVLFSDDTREDHGLDPVAEGQRVAVILWTDDTTAAYEGLVAGGAHARGRC